MDKKKIRNIITMLLLFFLITPTLLAANIYENELNRINPSTGTLGSEYKGHLRIYIVEIESRWKMENRAPYKYAFFDFAFNDAIRIPYLESYEDTIIWNGDIEQDNIIILAAVFNNEANKNYADPPFGRPFNAYYVDAAAGALIGETGDNVKNDEFTHTVFCEVGTATWCPACPNMASELMNVFTSGKYPFFFVEMVTDMNSDANSRMSQYNQKYLPTAFYDGGLTVVIGGGAGVSYHENVIKQAGKRDVHDLNLSLSPIWIGNGEIEIFISITNNEELPNSAPEKPTISGPSSGKPKQTYEYSISTTDPDGDDVFYMIDWGDGTITEWLGPYISGEAYTFQHEWDKEGTFIVKVKAKDLEGAETDWTWLKVSMPYINQGLHFQKMLNNYLRFYNIAHSLFNQYLPFIGIQ
jgi:thiol-disulfide isomerase/thioredoxin